MCWSELAVAERNLLDLDNAALEIADTRVVVDGKNDESDGKSESGRRVISLDRLTVAYLRRHLAMPDTEKEAFGDSYHDSDLADAPMAQPSYSSSYTGRSNRTKNVPGARLRGRFRW
jgi:hypothetical protein